MQLSLTVSGLCQNSSMIGINEVFRWKCFYFFYSIIEVIGIQIKGMAILSLLLKKGYISIVHKIIIVT